MYWQTTVLRINYEAVAWFSSLLCKKEFPPHKRQLSVESNIPICRYTIKEIIGTVHLRKAMYFMRLRNREGGSGRKIMTTAAVVKRQTWSLIRTVVVNDESNLGTQWEEKRWG